ncbi:hypothetical protein FA13DRAFT_714239 [Coprinellus micaceus]|uniref:Fungal N-terminal domain-containing protein n=1 Tax=Coprinellus micaceus TaxID=71717 RepID=A0A4Y7TVK5_COPMI|nr:hypothetical protein FA13DRAFT_714239 [Coprinellus micaceus]
MTSVSASSTISRSALRRWIEQAKTYVSPERDSGTLVPRTKNWKRLLRPFARKLVVVAEVGGTSAEIAPVIGPSVKGALKALSQVLSSVETHYQNQDNIVHLREKLQSLEERLVDYCPTSENVALLVRCLVSTQRTLEELLSASSLDHDHVASAIAQCERDVSFFLDEFSASPFILRSHPILISSTPTSPGSWAYRDAGSGPA